MMLMLGAPAMVGLIVLAGPIVELVFERGSFSPEDTRQTAAALAFYAPGLLGYSAVRITVPCFYALGSSLTPTLISVASVALNIVLNVVLVDRIGYRGLALGTSIAALVNAGLLFHFLRRRLGGLDTRRLLVAFAKIAVAAGLMGAAVPGIHAALLESWPGAGLLARAGARRPQHRGEDSSSSRRARACCGSGSGTTRSGMSSAGSARPQPAGSARGRD